MKTDRINFIWEYLRQKNTHNTKKVIRWGIENGFSNTQIRRDLHKLEKKGYLTLKYGLITILSTDTMVSDEKTFYNIPNINLKEIIANKTLSLIEDEDILFCSAGSTIQTLMINLNKKVNTFITNGLDSFTSAEKSKFINNKILIGGDWCPDNRSFVGSMTEEQIKIFNFNKTIISCDFIDKDYNIYINNYRECKIISQVIKNSSLVILVVDSSKFNKKGLVILTKLSNIDYVVTDIDAYESFLDKEMFQNTKFI